MIASGSISTLSCKIQCSPLSPMETMPLELLEHHPDQFYMLLHHFGIDQNFIQEYEDSFIIDVHAGSHLSIA